MPAEPKKRGRPALSSTGERRREWRISVAPSVREMAESQAEKQGVSPSAWVEALILEKESG